MGLSLWKKFDARSSVSSLWNFLSYERFTFKETGVLFKDPGWFIRIFQVQQQFEFIKSTNSSFEKIIFTVCVTRGVVRNHRKPQFEVATIINRSIFAKQTFQLIKVVERDRAG